MFRLFSIIVICVFTLNLFAQERVTRTPELDSLQEVLGGLLWGLDSLVLEDPNHAGVLRQFADYLDDERPWLFELGYHGTYSQTFGSKVAELLKYKSDFVNLRVTDSLTAAQLIGFLDKYGSEIVFSPFLSRYTEIPLSHREVEYRLLARRQKPNELGNLNYQIKEIERRLKYGHYGDVASVIGRIGRFKTPEAYQFLEECADGKHWGKGKNDQEENVYANICKSLGEFQTLEAAKLILRIAEEQELGESEFIGNSLARITNLNHSVLGVDSEEKLDWYRSKMSAHPTIRGQVIHGYDLVAPFRIADYEDSIDYYGDLILGSRNMSWLNEHAVKDALATGDPVSLVFVGAQITHQSQQTNDYGWKIDQSIPRLLESMTEVTVEVRTSEGEWTDQYPDAFSRSQYAAYWIQHFQDYEWDARTTIYRNGVDPIAPLDSVGYWFDQLYQPLKEPALTAFFLLTEQDSTRVDARMTHYDMGVMADDFSDHLSSFTNRFLPQLTRLSAWYRSEEIEYHNSPRLQFLIDRIFQKMPDNERLWLEDSIIRVLLPEEIVPFEYYFIVRSNDTWVMRNGQSRILDRWYGRNWQTLMRNRLELRSYLKRSYHYDLLGIIGNQNKYTQRFRNAEVGLLAALREVRETDMDAAIRTQAAAALAFMEPSAGSVTVRRDTAEIAEELKRFTELSAPTTKDFSGILNRKGLTPIQQQAVLAKLPKLASCSDIVNIRFNNVSIPLKYFVNFHECLFDARGVSIMVRLFEEVGRDTLLTFVSDQSEGFSLAEKGELFYKLLYNTDFKEWVEYGAIPVALREEIEPSLEHRLGNLEKWQDFDRSALTMMLEDLRFGGQPKAERIKRILADTSVADAKDILKNILERAVFSELADICDTMATAQVKNFDWMTLLIDDWGIPLLFPDSIPLQRELADDLRTLSEEALYWKYLAPYRLELKPGGVWDFMRVYDILEFDTVDGFVGGGGGRFNNEYVYALIRLLELEFGTRLEEPRKFNNSINSRTFSRAKRAAKWQDFLKNEGLVNLPDGYVRSISNMADR